MSLAEGTLVLLADGRPRPVELIVAGTNLLGPDGKIRRVLSTATGHGPLYRINPRKGEPWTCAGHHTLTLVKSSKGGNIISLPLRYWSKEAPWLKRDCKQFSIGVLDYPKHSNNSAPLPIDPYFLGVWFGDGTKTSRELARGRVVNKVAITTTDPEIVELCNEQARAWNLHVHTTKDHRGCPTYAIASSSPGQFHRNDLLRTLRSLVGPEIKVPEAYIFGSHLTRLQFLAGLLDSDGGLDWTKTTFFITQKREDWARAPWRLARSLGLYAGIRSHYGRYTRTDGSVFEGVYWTVTISGNTDQIPTRICRKRAQPRKQIKNAARTSFSATPVGRGIHYGFSLSGDARFLLGDFTVTGGHALLKKAAS
jgi:replicative DNA helicase